MSVQTHEKSKNSSLFQENPAETWALLSAVARQQQLQGVDGRGPRGSERCIGLLEHLGWGEDGGITPTAHP